MLFIQSGRLCQGFCIIRHILAVTEGIVILRVNCGGQSINRCRIFLIVSGHYIAAGRFNIRIGLCKRILADSVFPAPFGVVNSHVRILQQFLHRRRAVRSHADSAAQCQGF